MGKGFEVGDEIEVRIDKGRGRQTVYTGTILKIVERPTYTMIKYKMPNGETNVVSESYEGLSRRNILDKLVDGVK